MDRQSPPLTHNPKGELRRVGVEIEFAGIAPHDAAGLVTGLFGGQLEMVTAHRLKVAGTRWGDFTIELDTKYAHPDAKVVEKPPRSEADWDRQYQQLRVEFHTRTRELIGDVVTGLVPTEIICPPIPWSSLTELDDLLEALRGRGAKGSDASLFYGFGLHLNPEVPSLSTESLLAHLQAYMMLADWLRDAIDVDLTREVLPHTNPFPKGYATHILDPDYQPDLDTLIADYLAFNPTRNRELDMFPLFAYLRPDYPSPLFQDVLVKPRPTFHYRLPNAQFSSPDWGVTTEWQRWLEVERLAADPVRLEAHAREYLAHHAQSPMSRWLDKLRKWMHE
ncbi:amidoligase family protein [Litchfieldella xinjiangensis]|uniref:amidoligase family protein n=1 Tax=Litchfieldella xinjiangensis TaxID=1166948 RepID=UPI0005BD56B7|nr:amidoligase family protein [Halomonas xinjiangensis]